jgi:hypothetical protein
MKRQYRFLRYGEIIREGDLCFDIPAINYSAESKKRWRKVADFCIGYKNTLRGEKWIKREIKTKGGKK